MISNPHEHDEDLIAPTTNPQARWLTPGVWGIGLASLLSDAGHEVPTSLFASFLVGTLGASAAILGLIEGIVDGMAGIARLAGGALSDDPVRRRRTAIGGYTSTAVLSALIDAATAVWQVVFLRVAAWFSRGLRVPARNTLLADVVPASVYGRAYGFERAMDNFGAIVGPLLAFLLVSLLGGLDGYITLGYSWVTGCACHHLRCSSHPTTNRAGASAAAHKSTACPA